MCWFACGAILTSSQLSLIPHFCNFLPPSTWLHVMRSTHKKERRTTAKESATRPQREVGTKLFLFGTCWHCKYDETRGEFSCCLKNDKDSGGLLLLLPLGRLSRTLRGKTNFRIHEICKIISQYWRKLHAAEQQLVVWEGSFVRSGPVESPSGCSYSSKWL